MGMNKDGKLKIKYANKKYLNLHSTMYNCIYLQSIAILEVLVFIFGTRVRL